MDTRALLAYLDEIDLHRPDVLAVIEGLRHTLEQMDLLQPTIESLRALMREYERREALMVALQATLIRAVDEADALIADTHPALPTMVINPAAFADMDQNKQTILLAQSKFIIKDGSVSGSVFVGPEIVDSG